MRLLKRCLALAVASLLGCASSLPADQVQTFLRDALLAAKIRHAKGDKVEALMLVDSTLRVDKEFPGAGQLQGTILKELGELAAPRPRLGSNYLLRPPAVRTRSEKMLWYLPDRALDFLDLVSFDANIGPGIFLSLHATRKAQIGGGYRAVGGVGWHTQRSFGGMTQYESGVSAGDYSATALTGHKAGSLDQENTFHWHVDRRLREMAAALKEQRAVAAEREFPSVEPPAGPPPDPRPPLPGKS